MTDSLLSSSAVRLFGRVIEGVYLTEDIFKGGGGSGVNKVLRRQLEENKTPDKRGGAAILGAKFARIYAISFEGKFYNLPKPTVFLVSDDGSDPKGNTGMAATDIVFEGGVRCWVCDKDDVALRADVVTGTLDDILIDATLSSTSKYPITSRGQEASWRDGQMIARNRLQQ